MEDKKPRVVSPPLDELHKLRQPMTEGERRVLNFFLKTLPPSWEIYVQPHLNGLRPDFVLLHPERGIAVYEVKDWNLGSIDYFVREPRKNGGPELMGHKDGQVFSKEKDNPVRKIALYKDEIYSLYCPRLPARTGLGSIIAGIIFPFALTVEAEALLKSLRDFYEQTKYPKLYPVIGSDVLADATERSLRNKVLSTAHQNDDRMSDEVANDLRHWLVEADAAIEQRQPLLRDLTPRQRELVTTRTATGYRRVRGAAGSGKTLVLAGRAAHLAAEGKRVLVITFNITLINYILDFAVRFAQSGSARRSIVALNFHLWCKRVACESGHMEDYDALWNGTHTSTEVLERELPGKVPEWLRDVSQDYFFDAILVDEGQDLHLSWWVALRAALKPKGEALLCADRVQNIYGVTPWTEGDMNGAGFRGGWVTLKQSFRMSPALCDLSSRFVDAYLPHAENLRPEPTVETEFEFKTVLRWKQVDTDDAAYWCVEALEAMVAGSEPPIAYADLTCIVANETVGKQVIELLKARNIRCVHTFGDGNDEKEKRSDSRRRRFAFYKGDARVKVTTLHSFKGWESKALVVHIHSTKTTNDLALAYVSLTRLKRVDHGCYLTVVCDAPELEPFGRTWPSFEHVAPRLFALAAD